jgi:hypothetical protein
MRFISTISSKIPKNVWIAVMLLVFAVVVKFVGIQQHLFFGFEQGRDALRIQSLLHLEDVFLVGPKTDIDGIFHGPWYYYLMTIPYFIGRGEPLAASVFLILLNATIPVIFFFWWYQISHKKSIGIVAAAASLFSFELFAYSRWLSNVSPALPLFTAGYYCLWKYQQAAHSAQKKKNPKKKTKQIAWWFVVSATLMGFAAQFEIILSLWLLVAIVVLLGSKIITMPSWQTVGLSLLGAGFWYLPLVVFNLKYDFISLTAVLAHLSENGEKAFSLAPAMQLYGAMVIRLWQKTALFLPSFFSLVGLAITGVGLAVLYAQKKQLRGMMVTALVIVFSTFPVVFFIESLTLVQVYAGIGIAMIQALLLALYGFFVAGTTKNKYQLLARIGGVCLGVLLLASGVRSTAFAWQDKGTFFRTIQDDLNYADQKRILAFIQENKPHDEAYFVKAFTIPYYQEEGWLYLHQHHLGDMLEPGANTIFVIIEEKVDPYWRDQWLLDLGETEVLKEQVFGKITVQKRQRI